MDGEQGVATSDLDGPVPHPPASIPERVPIPEELSERAPELVRDPVFKHFYQVLARVAVGVVNHGFTHAGNLAYLTLIGMFPFFIVVAALANLIGHDRDTMRAIAGVLQALPSNVQSAIRAPLVDVVHARSGSLLWLGGLVGLWTATSLIEAIRDMLRSAYGAEASVAFWRYRLASMGMILVAIILMLLSFSTQLILTGLENLIFDALPATMRYKGWLFLSRLIQAVILFLTLYFVIFALTPSVYRTGPFPKWPGALFTTLWWQAGLIILPFFFTHISNYGLTYGSLAGVIVALLFFWFVGLGLVIGAYLNAALVHPEQLAAARAAARAEQ